MRRSLIAAILCVFGAAARGDLLDFEDVVTPAGGLGALAGPYEASGYVLASTSGFSARGPGADSANFTPSAADGTGAITTSLAAFAPGTITLARSDGGAFALVSIELAREFLFNTPSVGIAYPEVTFVGHLGGGGEVVRTFDVDRADFAFKTFAFGPGFGAVVSVSWEQPPFAVGTPADPAPGLHQFDNIVVLAAVPEPSSLALLVAGSLAVAARRKR